MDSNPGKPPAPKSGAEEAVREFLGSAEGEKILARFRDMQPERLEESIKETRKLLDEEWSDLGKKEPSCPAPGRNGIFDACVL